MELNIVQNAALVQVSLYYQGTLRDYVSCLRDEINGTDTTLFEPAPADGQGVYYYLAGKTQFIDTSLLAHYTDTGLKPSAEVCYVVTAWNDCDNAGAIDPEEWEESGTNNSGCAAPTRK
ncbi:hypothetical protein GCM10011352_35840 [Marinobacterium zhoushanense]|uniref:Uncharacterized protein n=1 Tax=Marinobacterium zhoushanense TaxID=1679163 RepID=A0ABQ1KSV0_9GAMM|nr:hypothetical protein [Marinobacterium zhoushanense]GGC06454.1 hypothetical protein GCM10011352_35840 [Marinobacterium zhoushanense]